MTREEILNKLHEGVVTVSFTKKDGTTRVMSCTLNEAYLPPHDPGEAKQHRERNLDVIPVWDVEKNAWRSFRVDSVESVKG